MGFHSNDHSLPAVFLAIPARLNSSRLPEKPLAYLGNRRLVEWVAQRALKLAQRLWESGQSSLRAAHVFVATDDRRIQDVVEACGVRAVLTDPALPSGTDRVNAALDAVATDGKWKVLGSDLVVNVQGDEPFFSLDDVCALVREMLHRPEVPMGTLAFERCSTEMFLKSSCVKLTTASDGTALYFSRAPIPWPRQVFGADGKPVGSGVGHEGEQIRFLQHLGVYAFRAEALRRFARHLPPSDLERREGLEQLRALEAGWKIAVTRATAEPSGIDTPEDLALARELVERGGFQDI